MSSGDPYREEIIALATMHAKEHAVSKPFRRWLGANVIVASTVNTDAFGTFTGEIARQGTMLDAARCKAQAAIDTTGFPFGLGSEGSFGPHPALPIISADREVLLFTDRRREFTIHETVVTHRTNYNNRTCEPGEDINEFLCQIQFPTHAVVVTPNASPTGAIVKGIKNIDSLDKAIIQAASISNDGLALVVSDMRAHVNPTRLAVIRALSSRLARRLSTPCPACQTPGFGATEIIRGLPCAWCGEPTGLALAERRCCAKCEFEHQIPNSKQRTANPGQCSHCNP